MSFGHALYYPHINLRNKNWVKHALLFWDRISRIVPPSVDPADDEDVIRIKDATDFISDYHPNQGEISYTYSEFSSELRKLIESDSFFNDRFFRAPRRRDYMRDFDDRRSLFSQLVESTGSYIHVEKLHPEVKEYLFQLGIAIPGRNEWTNWIKIDNEIGLLYMTYLAKAISKHNTVPIVTDVEQAFTSSISFESPINSDWKSEFEYNLGNLLIETVIPMNINNVSIDKILTIRTKYSDERTAFFNEVSNLSNNIPSIDNANSLKDAVNQQSKLVLLETKRLEQLYRAHKIETATKFLSISLPTTLATVGEYLPTHTKPIVASAGIIFGLIAAAKSVKKEKLELQANPKSYLLNIKSELSGEDYFHRLNDSIAGLRKW